MRFLRFCLLLLLLPLAGMNQGCTTALYISVHASGEDDLIRQTSEWPVGNLVRLNTLAIGELWEEPEDDLFPPRLDETLSTLLYLVDYPISLTFDLLLFPWQIFCHEEYFPGSSSDL